MVKNDSSRERVGPIFDELFRSDRTGATWLSRLLATAHRQDAPPIAESLRQALAAPGQITGVWWRHCRLTGVDDATLHRKERAFPAPRSLLTHLLRAKPATPQRRWGTGETLKRRISLFGTDDLSRYRAVADGEALLARNSRAGWHVLEGPSYPDVTI